jgi:phospholipase/carboxylesterase
MNTSVKYLLLFVTPVIIYIIKKNNMATTTIKETTGMVADSLVLQYLVREPKIKAENTKAIILLHGVGSNEKDLFGLADQLPDEFLVISPRGQFTLSDGRYAWYNVDFSTGKPIFNAAQEVSSRKIIKKFVEQVKQKYSVDEIYLGGFSQGAIMSYSVGLTNPKEIKGILSLSGRLLMEVRPLVTKNVDVQQLKVFVAHGIQDNTLPVHYAREAKLYLEELGVQLSYNEYEIGHQISVAVIMDMNAWLTK